MTEPTEYEELKGHTPFVIPVRLEGGPGNQSRKLSGLDSGLASPPGMTRNKGRIGFPCLPTLLFGGDWVETDGQVQIQKRKQKQ